MKNIIKIIILLIGLGQWSFAQGQNGKTSERKEQMLERLEAQRVAYMTTSLDLTAEESARFWPVYNEYFKYRLELRKEMRGTLKDKDLNENQSAKVVENQLALQEKELALKKNYYEKFKAILPSSKLAKLETAEQEFKQEVVKKLKERRQNRIPAR